jgi:hypothetical protein
MDTLLLVLVIANAVGLLAQLVMMRDLERRRRNWR